MLNSTMTKYQVGDIVVITETARTSLNIENLNKLVVITAINQTATVYDYTTTGGYEPAVHFERFGYSYYALESSIRHATKLEKALK